ncbi:MAG: hypothetical protein KA403_02685 [Candidatus Omnitrophica bacterium]|nr:hypothetical protein [Candidatus Omnitrophota bacterium]
MKNFILTIFIAFVVFPFAARASADDAENAQDLFADKSMDEMLREHQDMAEEMLIEPVNPESNENSPRTIDELYEQSQRAVGEDDGRAVLSP